MTIFLDDQDEPHGAEAERRDVFLRQLLKASGWKATRDVVDAAHSKFWGWPIHCVPHDQPISCNAKSIQPAALCLRDSERCQAHRQQGRTCDCSSDRPVLAQEGEAKHTRALIERVHEACLLKGLRLPHRGTIQRRINELDTLAAAQRRGDKAVEAATTPSVGSLQAERPNEIWQTYHTIVDMIVVDEETRQPIGRPALTIAIDIAGRIWQLAQPLLTYVRLNKDAIVDYGARYRSGRRIATALAESVVNSVAARRMVKKQHSSDAASARRSHERESTRAVVLPQVFKSRLDWLFKPMPPLLRAA